MKIKKFLPKDVDERWNDIRYSLAQVIFPANEDVMQKVLIALLSEVMQCWCVYNDERNTVYGYIVTSIEQNLLNRYLFVYSAFLDSILPEKEDYMEMVSIFKMFARDNRCQRIVAFSNNPQAISLAKKMGFMSDYTILTKEV